MSNIIQFPAPINDNEQPLETFTTGEAKCLNCNHEWSATAPSGITFFQCPSCETMKGVFVHPISNSKNNLVHQCDCGCNYNIATYYHDSMHFICANCGKDNTNDILNPKVEPQDK